MSWKRMEFEPASFSRSRGCCIGRTFVIRAATIANADASGVGAKQRRQRARNLKTKRGSQENIDMEIIDLTGRKGLVVGIANQHSLAWSAAQHFRNAGADLAITYLNDKAKPFVESLAREAEAPIFLPCDVTVPGQVEALFEAVQKEWGRLDFLFHAIAWARKEDLHGRLTDCSADGFAESMLISCHSLIAMAKLAEPLMDKGGSLMTLSYFGAEKVVDHYNVMGPVKAALESSVRYLAHELGGKAIRVNAISAGAVKTRAASGIEHFDELLNESIRKAPLRRIVDACEIGRVALLLASDYTGAITGEVLYVDAGFHIEGMVLH
jgi:enoyl-[acyl-carrier protein] reductase I